MTLTSEKTSEAFSILYSALAWVKRSSAVDVTFFHELQKSAGDGGFVVKIHGEERVVPATKNTEALEIQLVLFHVAVGGISALVSKLCCGGRAFSAQLFFHLGLDGQAVAIPAWDIGGV